MKITVFSDLHAGEAELTCGNRYPSLSFCKLDGILDIAKEFGSDLLLCLGDITDGSEYGDASRSLERVSGAIKKAGIRFLCLPGNHDLYCMNEADFREISGFELPQSVMKLGDSTAIFLDACYSAGDVAGPVRYFSDGKKCDWKDTCLPADQLTVLADTLDRLPDGSRVTVFSHQLILPGGDSAHSVKNADAVREILEKHAERLTITSISGHYHRGGGCESSGIKYTVLPAACTGKSLDPNSVIILEL